MSSVTEEIELQRAITAQQAGRLADAEPIYRRILSQNPNHDVALHMLGLIAKSVGRGDVAIELISRSVAIQPHNPVVWSNLAEIWRQEGRPDEAVRCAKNALQVDPNYAPAHHNLAAALEKDDQIDQAIDFYRSAIRIDPNFAQSYVGLGSALRLRADFDASANAYRKAVELMPNHAEAHARYALLLLLKGRFKEGFDEYEWRFADPKFSPLKDTLPRPRWDGSDLAGRTILLRAEQGWGDTMQFIRYAPLIAQRGGKVIVQCPEVVRPLLEFSFPDFQYITSDQTLPQFDVQCPLLSLPHAFGTTIETIPANVPYLKADPARVGLWRKECTGNALNVGLVWAGRPEHVHDRLRSISPETFASLAAVPNVRWFSLQKGPAAKNPPAKMRLIDTSDRLHDFSDTAALVEALDLVITVDTAVAHLAGALAKPIWTLIAAVPDWRWLLDRTDTPWYPTMRLFRQSKIGDWPSVIENVTQELRKKLNHG